jgi:uncharacterized protein (DUF885 family)
VLAAAPAAADRAQDESKKLNAIFDEYFEEYLQQNPILATSIGDPRYNDRFVVGISPAAIAAEQKLQRDYLARVQTVDRAALPPADQLSYDIFKSGREREIEGFKFPDELMPLNQFYSTPHSLGPATACSRSRPCRTTTTSCSGSTGSSPGATRPSST